MNNDLKATKLTVKSFRGINDEITLQLGKITVLEGENGTGKSSFVNAIEYLFSEELSFLKNKTIDSEKSLVHKDAKLNDVKIELKFNKRYVRFESSKLENTPRFNDILKNPYVKNASFILNRKKLLQFIEGTQGDRYNALMGLCGLDKIDKIQSTLSSSKTTISKELQKISNNYKVVLSDLSSLLTDKSDSNFEDCIKILNNRLDDNGKDIIDENTNIEEFVENLDLSDYVIIENKIDSFNQIYENINLIDFDIRLNEIIDEYEYIASDNLKTSNSLLKSLSTSKDYIELTNSDLCPVCENSINPNEILTQISQKIEDINKNNSSLNNWKNSVNSFISDLQVQINNCIKLNEIINELNELIDNILPNFEFNELINLKNDLNEFMEFNKVASEFVDINFTSLNSEITSVKKLLVDYESNQNVDEMSNIYNILFKIKELNELQSQINVLTKRNEVATKTFNVFTQSKEKFIGDMISEIKSDIKTYYEYIHGNDLISAPDIQLSGPKLIDVYLNSFGDVVDSRSYASEGHLDTLGICIFLAFNKKFNDLPLIVFDDVLTTVDLPHKERIARLLVDKLDDYQFIITTHSSLWSEQLKRLCNDIGVHFERHEFIDWSLIEGPIVSKSLDDSEKILKYLSNDNLDFQAAGNAARRYLERTLIDICKLNNIKVPINDKYDVGTLFDEVKSFTKNIVEGTSLQPYYERVWSEANQTKHTANLLSHYNEQSSQLPRSDVEKFCYDVINLRQAYTCDCGYSLLILDDLSKKLICPRPKCRDTIDMNSFKDIDFMFVEKEIEG